MTAPDGLPHALVEDNLASEGRTWKTVDLEGLLFMNERTAYSLSWWRRSPPMRPVDVPLFGAGDRPASG